jgi:hypothetical protein
MYQVEWLESALDELTTLWLQAEAFLRPAITAATHQIDQQLRTDPIGGSESRSGITRVLFANPLGVNFYLEPGRRAVCVTRVWLYRKRN